MQFKYIVLITWFVGLILLVGGLYLKDTKIKRKKLCKALFIVGTVITYIVAMYLVFGVILPSIGK